MFNKIFKSKKKRDIGVISYPTRIEFQTKSRARLAYSKRLDIIKCSTQNLPKTKVDFIDGY